MISDDERSVSRPKAFCRIRNDGVPLDFAVPGVQSQQVAIGRGEIDGFLVDRRAAMPDVEGVVLGVLVMPDLLAGALVDGPEIVGRGDVDIPFATIGEALSCWLAWNFQTCLSFEMFSGVISLSLVCRLPV